MHLEMQLASKRGGLRRQDKSTPCVVMRGSVCGRRDITASLQPVPWP